jgi:hypothetical protein
MQGRRRPDVHFGQLPDDLQPGDYWKYVDDDGQPLSARAHCGGESGRAAQNLTDTMWGFYSPDGNGCGTLAYHTVREHADGTISIRPGDGSSNSVLHSGGAKGLTWHGYVEHGVWREC